MSNAENATDGPGRSNEGPLARYAAVGFATELLPLLPPDARLSSQSRVGLTDRGKVPGLYHPATGLWTGFPDWPQHQASAEDLARWQSWPAPNIGLQGRTYHGFDIDTENVELVRKLIALAHKIFGPAPMRGRAGSNRCLLVYRASGDGPAIIKMRLAWVMPGDPTKHAVELLGQGHQYVIEGRHPKGGEYFWADDRSLDQWPPDTLSPISMAQWTQFEAEARELIEQAGGTLLGRTAQAEQRRRPLGQLAEDERRWPELGRALSFIPNETLNYDEWIAVLAAARGACGGAEDFFVEYVLPWSLRYPGNTEEVTREKWDSLHDTSVGAVQLIAKAREHGYDGTYEFDPIEDDEPEEEPLPTKLNDIMLADMFAAAHAGDMAYVAIEERWLIWDGQRWRPDEAGRTRFIVARFLGALATRHFNRGGPKHNTLAQWLGAHARVSAVCALLECHEALASTPELWDRNPLLLNTPAGTYDLTTGAMRPADPADRLTHMTAVVPSFEMSAFLDRMLDTVTCRRRPLRDYLQRLAGYWLTGLVSEEIMAVLIGGGGAGKGTYLETLCRALGTYAWSLPLDFLGATKHDRHPTSINALAGKRLAVIDEVQKGRLLNEALMKQLTGGGTLNARGMHENERNFAPTCKLVVATNFTPRLNSTGPEIARRLHLVPFDAKPAGEPAEPDPTIKTKMLAEEQARLLGWAIEGAIEYGVFGLAPPEEVVGASRRYLRDEDRLQAWLDERVLTDAKASPIATQTLFDDYREWARASGEEHVPSLKMFSMDLSKKGFRREREGGTGRSVFIGLRFRNPHGFDVLDGGRSDTLRNPSSEK